MAQARTRPHTRTSSTRPKGGKRAGAGRWGSGQLRCHTCQHPERSRIDYLLASGTAQHAIAKQFGLVQQNVGRHYRLHVSDRYKAMVKASHNETFEKLLENATEANSESVDTLNLLIRGHSQMWGLALEAGDHKLMTAHSSRILQALEIRSKITLELAPSGGVTVNNFLMRDAAELVNTLRGNAEAVARIEDWYRWRTQGRLIEAEAAVEEHAEAAE